jgi:predicted enzyme related to lactoylglutathione lyase
MTEMTNYAPGMFSWVDLATTDSEGAKAFYMQLFGWTATDMPTDTGNVYTMFEKEGKDVCALWAMGPDLIEQGVPPHWQSYVTVTSVDQTMLAAKGLGGKVIMEPFDVMEAGRMGLIQDPTGAVIALWEPNQHSGAKLVNAPGSWCWNELQTTDPVTAEAFYAALLGWGTRTEDHGAGGQPYTAFLLGGRAFAGMLEIRPEWGEVPPNWAVYFAVEDCDQAVSTIHTLGGQIIVDPMEVAGVGRFAFARDPQGGVFAVVALARAD